MRSGNARGGFTLIEVIVALAICAGALVVLASVGNESLRRSLRAREAARLDLACRNKLAECACGAEEGRQGALTGLPGWRWKAEYEPVLLEDIERLERVKLEVTSPDGLGAGKTYSVLRYRPKEKP